MTLTVGTNTYVTLAEYKAYWSSRGVDLDGEGDTDAAHEADLARALDAIDRGYIFKGYRAEKAQALEWPRFDVGYVGGWLVEPDIVPQRVKDAQCEMAYLIRGGATPFATITGGAVVSKTESVDVISESVQYAGGIDRPSYPAVDQLLRGYYASKSGGRILSVEAVRA